MHKIFVSLICFSACLAYGAKIVAEPQNCFAPEGDKNNQQGLNSSLLPKSSFQLSSSEYQQWQSRCLLDASEVKKKIAKNFVIIDVRDQTVYQNGHIAGSLNIPLYQVKTKSYLKNKRVILVNEGYDRKSLVLACRQLRQSGFKNIYVLKDGLPGWQKLFGKIDHRNQDSARNTIPSNILFHERESRDWLVLYMARKKKTRLKQYFKSIIYTKNIGNINTIKRLIKKQQSRLKSEFSIVVVDAAGDNNKGFNSLYQALQRPDVFYLRGGLKAFEKFVKNQYAMLSKREFVLQKPKSCSQ